jgi:hypothetical protein
VGAAAAAVGSVVEGAAVMESGSFLGPRIGGYCRPPIGGNFQLMEPLGPGDVPALMATEPPANRRYRAAEIRVRSTDLETWTRRCSDCREWLPLEEFPPSRGMVLDRRYRCRPCWLAYRRERRAA